MAKKAKAEKAPATTEELQKSVDNIKANSICVFIKMSRFTVRRTVKQDKVNVEATDRFNAAVDQDLMTVAKDLLDSQELRKIVTYDHVTKVWVKARTVQSPLLRASAYLLDVDALPDMYEYLEQRKKNRGALVQDVAAAYPALVKAAKERLGPLFDQSEYPPVAALLKLFDFEWSVIEIVTPNEKLRTISQALFEKEKSKAEAVWKSAVGQINDALAASLNEVVEHLGDRLGGGDEAPKRFRASALKKVTDFIETFAQRNVAGSAGLAKLVGDAKAMLEGVDVKAIKTDGDLRKRLATSIAGIKSSLDGMMENKPARAISVGGDEAI